MKRKGNTPLQRGTPEERFWPKVDKNGPNGCWNWLGALVGMGYGHFRISATERTTAHVFAYRKAKGDYPEGLQLDHLCRNTRCVNPDHLEPVPPRTNFLRSQNRAAIAARTNICLRGHSLLDCYVSRDGRQCKTCHRDRNAENYKRTAALRKRLLAEARRQIAIFHGITYLTPEGREDVLHHELRDPELGVG